MGLILAGAVAQLPESIDEVVGKGGVGIQALHQGGLHKGDALFCTGLVGLL